MPVVGYRMIALAMPHDMEDWRHLDAGLGVMLILTWWLSGSALYEQIHAELLLNLPKRT